MVMGKLQVASSDEVAAGAMESKAEEISLLVDGELDVERIEGICTRVRDINSMTTWVCYHVIGDALRGSSRAGTEQFSSNVQTRRPVSYRARILAALPAQQPNQLLGDDVRAAAAHHQHHVTRPDRVR
jgi:hypothetical protein